eukprot:CAMPEP_0197873276 /NCGR_PEP_ID=MMETSP1439-20131203/3110_1 /TAXON_ID=66791 /ORGANISM="Gonyaulax spinifera, Strain CCMP409" /LENGTH=209 /DNA_ID=CAMNT_0043492319 /DNA_START=60 /DNA_END=689 /DNA_ORIENTATION=+
MARRAQSALLASGLLAVLAYLCLTGPAFVSTSPRPSVSQAPALAQPLLAASSAVLLAAAPEPAHAGGMFDFGLTLPFVAITFLTMMAVLNTLWYAPVTQEMDERNAKLLQTLSEATDMLTKADEIQVAYTEEVREAREKASAAVAEYRKTTEAAFARKVGDAATEREMKAIEVKAKLEEDVQARMSAAEQEIEKRKEAFVTDTLAAVAL